MDEEVDAFKKEFKRFKRPSEDDMKDIIDFTQPEKFDKVHALYISFTNVFMMSIVSCISIDPYYPDSS